MLPAVDPQTSGHSSLEGPSVGGPGPVSNSESSPSPGETLVGRPGILVLGMHRSGTSALAKVLVELGARVPDDEVQANEGNPRGYFEPRTVVSIHDSFLRSIDRAWNDPDPLDPGLFQGEAAGTARLRLGQLVERYAADWESGWVVKDPRMCRLMPLWDDVSRRYESDRPRVLHVLRSPLAVADSLEHRNDLRQEVSLLLWLRHNLEAEAISRGFDRTWVHFEWFFNTADTDTATDALRRIDILAEAPPGTLEHAVGNVMESKLVHHHHDPESTYRQLAAYPWIRDAYAAFDRLARGDEDGGRALLDGIRENLRHADRLLFRSLEERHYARYERLRQQVESCHRAVEAQRAATDAQRRELGAYLDALGSTDQPRPMGQERQHTDLLEKSLDFNKRLEKQWQKTQDDLLASQERLEQIAEEREEANTRVARLQGRLEHLQDKYHQKQLQAQHAEAEIANLKSSLSHRLTAPLRWLISLVKSGTGRR